MTELRREAFDSIRPEIVELFNNRAVSFNNRPKAVALLGLRKL